MSSWGPGFSQKKGHVILPYHHQIAFESYAKEFLQMIYSVFYAQSTLDFLFVFDKINKYSTQLGLFEQTLKKNNYIRYLPYYPNTGFNLSGRTDLIQPVFQKPMGHDRPTFFKICSQCFDLLDSVREKISILYEKHEVPFRGAMFAVCLLPNQEDYTKIKGFIQSKANQSPPSPFHIFVNCSSREDFQRFRESCPSTWSIFSMWQTIPTKIVTEEQRINELYSYIGSLYTLIEAQYLIGSFKHDDYRFAYCCQARFRSPENSLVYDGSSFSHF